MRAADPEERTLVPQELKQAKKQLRATKEKIRAGNRKLRRLQREMNVLATSIARTEDWLSHARERMRDLRRETAQLEQEAFHEDELQRAQPRGLHGGAPSCCPCSPPPRPPKRRHASGS